MKNRNKTAMPIFDSYGETRHGESGLTKLEEFTKCAMQGLLAAGGVGPDSIGPTSVEVAELVLAELDKGGGDV